MRSSLSFLPQLTPVMLALWPLLSVGVATAQTAAEPVTDLPAVVVKPRPLQEPRADVAGLPPGPAWQQPLQAQRFGAQALANAQVQRLADVVKLDASTSDAYNTAGYWDGFTVRGFTLDATSNYRREGLPISAETRLPLDNKAAVELLKGVSGLQAGVSAPGGLVNLVVKRPQGRVRQAELAWTGGSSAKAGVDLSDRFGQDQRFGLRVNAAAERLQPSTQATDGHRHTVAVATDWRLAPSTLLEAEIEHSRHRQPSMPGFSAYGARLPVANDIDPKLNLNQQPWSQPVDMQGTTGTLRWTQQWEHNWTSTVTYGEQALKTDDRAAFPFGCSAESTYLADRFCSDGSFDLYDFRSDDEGRRTRALNIVADTRFDALGQQHDLRVGWLRTLHRTDLSSQAFNAVGTLTPATATQTVEPNATAGFAVADRAERSTEWLLQDRITFNEQWRLWAGVRHTRLQRRSTPTDGRDATSRSEDITTPWVAVGYVVEPNTQAYVSWGQGAEVKTAPVDAFVVDNPGEILPATKSRQLEIGLKGEDAQTQWGLNWFRIHRPEVAVVDRLYQLDGESIHTGLEGHWQRQHGAWAVRIGAVKLDTSREGSAVVSEGAAAVNAPELTLKLSTTYRTQIEALGLNPVAVQADVVHEGRRWADKANTLRLPAWTRVDLAVRATQQARDHALTWQLGVTNLLDERAWRESPDSFNHIWLFPLAERQVNASLTVDF